jgi:triosephosphate isomerase
MTKKIIVANWKELPATPAEAEEILVRVDEWLGERGETDTMSLVVCPPRRYLDDVARMLKTGHLEHVAELGAQDLQSELTEFGVRYVIIGHSSRRAAGESDEIVNQKLKRALEQEFVPIVCVENAEQARATFAGISADDMHRCLVAYEPTWAISTNPGAHPDTPENAIAAVARIREVLGDQRFLYGGSITDANAKAFLERSEFSGVLIGGASVRAEEFCRILAIASVK